MNKEFYLQKIILDDGQEVVIQTENWNSEFPTLKLAIKIHPEIVFEGSIDKNKLKQIAQSLSQDAELFIEQNKKALSINSSDFIFELTFDRTLFTWAQQVGSIKVVYGAVNLVPSTSIKLFDLLCQSAETHVQLRDQVRYNLEELKLYERNINQLQTDYSEVLQDRVINEKEQSAKLKEALNTKIKYIKELEEQLEKYAEENTTQNSQLRS